MTVGGNCVFCWYRWRGMCWRRTSGNVSKQFHPKFHPKFHPNSIPNPFLQFQIPSQFHPNSIPIPSQIPSQTHFYKHSQYFQFHPNSIPNDPKLISTKLQFHPKFWDGIFHYFLLVGEIDNPDPGRRPVFKGERGWFSITVTQKKNQWNSFRKYPPLGSEKRHKIMVEIVFPS